MRLSCGYSQPQNEDPHAYLYDSWVRSGDRFTVLSVDSWIRIAVGPYLEELYLALFSCEDHGFRLPLSVLSCPNLHTVSLCGDIVVELEQSSAICLPSLKTLQLDIGNVDVNSVGILLSGCPILETLELSFSPTSLGKLCVPSSLKSLKFTVENDIGACLEIDAPGLRYLSLTKITFGDAEAVGNLHNVKEAYLDIFSTPENESVDPLLILLQALSEIKHLVLHCSIAKKRLLGGQPIIDFSKIQFPEFYHLRYLELILPTFDTFLYDVLQKCPMLQALIIQNNKDTSKHEYGLAVKPESVPNCVVSHLTSIHFKGYQGDIPEMEFANYVLQNGLVLKSMIITDFLLEKKEKWKKYRFRENLSNTPKGSTVCQVNFE
ncbi:F-box/RNI/FBD-like domain protein [Trifolium medium]|uniref:F-box/RNI/FBD-like domain protein n=1 Tax=Trifolium medium TaxID=97028 RepID=A0A392M366_9FABA|nr:F-box/RNI/FBD-like domain protein [Trifolium medium]